MSRISDCFSAAEENNKRVLIPYIAAGDPHPQETVGLLHTLVQAGADMIELGVPFSDPIADGPVIQRAYERALSHEVNLSAILRMVGEFRQRDSLTPIILMSYQNPIEAIGQKEFVEQIKQVGVDGVLTVDLPVEESAESRAALLAGGIDPIFLLSPTTSEKRVVEICNVSRGFIYYVALKGVTGAGHLDIQDVSQHLQMIRWHTKLPISVGFGIKSATESAQIASFADGIVIGSALVKIISNPALSIAARREKVLVALSAIRQTIDATMTETRFQYGVV